jgi:hypothetical protein
MIIHKEKKQIRRARNLMKLKVMSGMGGRKSCGTHH